MRADMWANRYRPSTFADVLGQDEEIAVLRKVVTSEWQPNALLFTGPFGTGKTTLARLCARAMLCDRRLPTAEPCGTCDSCRAMSRENHTNFIETDAASKSSVADVRDMKEEIAYRMGDKPKILCYDEAHMLSHAAQNALLLILEEGARGVLFMFATTEPTRVLPTVRSRCVELQMKLLTTGQITQRLEKICEAEGITHEGRSLRTVATYVRGHARDAITMLEQLARTANPITETLTRSYLKLDRHVEVYKILLEEDRKTGFQLLESLLCNLAPSEVAEVLGQALLDAYKLSLGIETTAAVDDAWLRRVLEKRDPRACLELAERVLLTPTDHASLSQALASLGNLLFEPKTEPKIKFRPQGGPDIPATPTQFRKPSK